MKKYIAFIFFISSFLSINAQGFEWVKKGGGNGADYGRDIAIDSNGDIYICGSYAYQTSGTYTAVFGTLSISNNSPGPNGYIAKYDTSGNVLWVQNIEGPEWEYAYDVTTDNNGNVFVAGEFESSVTIAGVTVNTTSSSQDGVYLAKFLSNGNLAWLISLEQSISIDVSDIIADNNGDVWITGNIDYWYIYLRKYSSIGGQQALSIQSVNTAGSPDIYASILQKQNANIYLIGRYGMASATVSMGSVTLPSVPQFSDLDIFIIKFDMNGVANWYLVGGGNPDNNNGNDDQDAPFGVSTDINGNLYLASAAKDTVTWGGLSLINNSGNWAQQYFVKISPSGIPKAISGIPINIYSYGGELHYPIIGGNIFFNLSFNDTVSIVGTTFTSTGQDHLVVAADTNFNIVGAYQIKQSALSNGIEGITANSNNDIFVTGSFRDLAIFGSIPLNTIGGNKADMFLTKVTPCIPPIVTLNPSGTLNLCQGNNILITATTNSSNATFQWYQNNQVIPNATAATYTIQQPGSYIVKASIGGSCQTSSGTVIVSATTINVQLQTSSSAVCQGATTQIQTVLPYQSYSWSNGQSGVSSIVVGSGNYYVIVVDANSCIDTASITINQYQSPSQPDILIDTNCMLACDTTIQTGHYKWRYYGNVVGGDSKYYDANLSGNGFYTVEITDFHGCKSMSNDKSVSCVVGIDEYEKEVQGISLYPNPTLDNFTILFDKPLTESIKVEITNVLGQVLFQKELPKNEIHYEFMINDYLKGFYFVKIQMENKEITKKLILQ